MAAGIEDLRALWTPQRIRALRQRRGQTQMEFARELYAGVTEGTAQKNVARMEMERDSASAERPSSAVVRMLQRMEAGEI